jgi:hypothetical protein
MENRMAVGPMIYKEDLLESYSLTAPSSDASSRGSSYNRVMNLPAAKRALSRGNDRYSADQNYYDPDYDVGWGNWPTDSESNGTRPSIPTPKNKRRKATSSISSKKSKKSKK